jgi:hypothetical protein
MLCYYIVRELSTFHGALEKNTLFCVMVLFVKLIYFIQLWLGKGYLIGIVSWLPSSSVWDAS